MVLAAVCAARVARADCVTVTDTAVTVATAKAAGEYTLALEGQSASATSWGEAGNEALVLEVSTGKRLIGHLILHQGNAKFPYGMHVGALATGDAVQLRVSPLSAKRAKHEATACFVALAITTDEKVLNAPEYRWPTQRVFDDVPLVVGWSKHDKAYVTVMTNEDGGTAESCGGGAEGMQAEIGRWGRSLDIEDHYRYGKAPHFERCTGANNAGLRMEGAHPILYWGNGHNRLFESRGGYGTVCGKRLPEKPDGDLEGWNIKNPGNDLAHDEGRVVILRPLPDDLDPLGYTESSARREALPDHYAPWIYRLSSLELAREGKMDGSHTFAMDRYLYVDVEVSGVAGEGGTYCALLARGGFKLRAVTKKGVTATSAQITSKYAFGGHKGWKRVAIPLPKGVTAADIDHFTFDAYDNNGITLTGLGDAFIPKADGDNGASLDYVRQGVRTLTDFVDDDKAACTDKALTCVGGQVDLKP